jgi:hypothetical protein
MLRAYYDGARGIGESLALEILGEAPGHKDALTALYNVRSDEGNMPAAEASVRRSLAQVGREASAGRRCRIEQHDRADLPR